MPPLSASSQATAIVGPSAMGSEKGICTSMMSAPPFTSASATFSESRMVGYPEIMCAMKNGRFPVLNKLSSLLVALILVFQEIAEARVFERAGEVKEVFVATTRERRHDNGIFRHLWRNFAHLGERMRAFESGNDAFKLCKIIRRRNGFVIGRVGEFDAPLRAQVGKFGPEPGIIKACGNRVRGCDLAFFRL